MYYIFSHNIFFLNTGFSKKIIIFIHLRFYIYMRRQLYKPVIFICKNFFLIFFINSLMVYTRRHTLYQLTNPLQFPHEPPGVREPHFGKPCINRSMYYNM